MKYNHIIWDWNGTLLNDLRLCVTILNLSLEKRSIPPISIEDYKKNFLFPIKSFYENIGFDFQKESFEESNEEFHKNFENNFKTLALQPYAKETISSIKSLGKTQSILSATMQEKLVEQVSFFSLESFIDNIVGLQNTPSGFGKEHEGRELLSYVEVPKEETIIVGDSMLDFNVSNSLGIDCALVLNGHNDYDRLKNTGSPVFKDIGDFFGWLKQP